jgi:hypothetical protein
VLQADSLAEYLLEVKRYRYFVRALEGIHDHVESICWPTFPEFLRRR